MIICHSKRFIFIHIQKAGGTSIELALDPFLSWSDLIIGSTDFGERIDAHYRSRFGLGKHSSLADIEAVCGGDILRRYYVFATVRDPLDRLCSLYNFVGSKVHKWAERQRIPPEEAAARITKEAEAQEPALKWPASRAFLEARSFSQFIRNQSLFTDPGFRPQAGRLRRTDGAIRAEFFRLEDQREWLPHMQETLQVGLVIPHANRSELRLMSRNTVSEEDRRYIQSRFMDDYIALGYPVDTQLMSEGLSAPAELSDAAAPVSGDGLGGHASSRSTDGAVQITDPG